MMLLLYATNLGNVSRRISSLSLGSGLILSLHSYLIHPFTLKKVNEKAKHNFMGTNRFPSYAVVSQEHNRLLVAQFGASLITYS